MLWQYFSTALVISPPLLISQHTAGGHFVPKANRFCMLPLTVFYYKIMFDIISICGQGHSRITHEKVKTMLTACFKIKHFVTEVYNIVFISVFLLTLIYSMPCSRIFFYFGILI